MKKVFKKIEFVANFQRSSIKSKKENKGLNGKNSHLYLESVFNFHS